jgi:hypothetical protein
LPKGTYRLEFGGKGVGRYFTHSIYDIEVTDSLPLLNDISATGKSMMARWNNFSAVKKPPWE